MRNQVVKMTAEFAVLCMATRRTRSLMKNGCNALAVLVGSTTVVLRTRDPVKMGKLKFLLFLTGLLLF